jgi:hypothetical protein
LPSGDPELIQAGSLFGGAALAFFSTDFFFKPRFALLRISLSAVK